MVITKALLELVVISKGPFELLVITTGPLELVVIAKGPLELVVSHYRAFGAVMFYPFGLGYATVSFLFTYLEGE